MAGIRRFAPLNPELQAKVAQSGEPLLPELKAIVFDVDGTLCKPQTWMFAKMREALGISKTVDILDHIESLPTVAAQEEGHEKIKAVEREAMALMEEQPGLKELMDYLDERGIPKALCTRNFDAPVNHLLTKFLEGHHFHPIVTRDFKPPKPNPAGIVHIANSLGVNPANTVMVGDSMDDMTAGRTAGSATVLLKNNVNEHCYDHEHTDAIIDELLDLKRLLENGFVGRDPAVLKATPKAKR